MFVEYINLKIASVADVNLLSLFYINYLAIIRSRGSW